MRKIRPFGAVAFYIGKVGDNILVVSKEEHPFNYPNELGKEIKKIAKNINKSFVNIYFDLSSILGENSRDSFFKMIYDVSNERIKIFSKENIPFNEFPDQISKKLKELKEYSNV